MQIKVHLKVQSKHYPTSRPKACQEKAYININESSANISTSSTYVQQILTFIFYCDGSQLHRVPNADCHFTTVKTDLFEEVGDGECSRPEAGQIAVLIPTGGPL